MAKPSRPLIESDFHNRIKVRDATGFVVFHCHAKKAFGLVSSGEAVLKGYGGGRVREIWFLNECKNAPRPDEFASLPTDHICFKCKRARDRKFFAPKPSNIGGLDHYCNDCRAEEKAQEARDDGRWRTRIRKVRQLFNGGHHTKEQWEALLLVCGGKCLRCGDTENITKDHVNPVVLGGSDDIAITCNRFVADATLGNTDDI